mgnify:CR=1 FL=1
MKVFISHKKEDSETASQIANYLRINQVGVYLDVIDNIAPNDAKTLTNHIKSRMSECTDLLVVMSSKTQQSWWVPFEIGMAAQQDYPMVSYLKEFIILPEYLSYYPKLKSNTDLYYYISAARGRINEKVTIEKQAGSLNESYNFSKRENLTEKFYRELKAKL